MRKDFEKLLDDVQNFHKKASYDQLMHGTTSISICTLIAAARMIILMARDIYDAMEMEEEKKS